MSAYLAILILPLLLGAQSAGDSLPNFPSDGQDPHRSGGAELLEAVCKTACPSYTGFPHEDLGWALNRVTRGHFLSPSNDDVLLSTSGCEPHNETSGGTILLTRRFLPSRDQRERCLRQPEGNRWRPQNRTRDSRLCRRV